MQSIATALGHRPALIAFIVKRDIEGAVVKGIAAALAGQGVIGRENAADEGDDREPVAAIRA